MEELVLLAEQTTESGSVADAELGEGSGRDREVYPEAKTRVEDLIWHRDLVTSVRAGER